MNKVVEYSLALAALYYLAENIGLWTALISLLIMMIVDFIGDILFEKYV